MLHPSAGQVMLMGVEAVDTVEGYAVNPDVKLRKGRVAEVGPTMGLEVGYKTGDLVYFSADAPLIMWQHRAQVPMGSVIGYDDGSLTDAAVMARLRSDAAYEPLDLDDDETD